MAPDDPQTWQEASAAVRVRLRQLEKESERTREAVHQLRSEVQATRYLGEKIAELALDVRELASRVETVSRHAVHRPSPSALSVLGQYAGLVVAIVAIVIAARS